MMLHVNLIKIGQLALEIFKFESVDDDDDDGEDGRRTIGILWAHHVSLQLRWANNPEEYILRGEFGHINYSCF